MSICGLANTDKVLFLFFFHKRVMTSRLRASSDNNGALEVFQRTTKKKREKKTLGQLVQCVILTASPTDQSWLWIRWLNSLVRLTGDKGRWDTVSQILSMSPEESILLNKKGTRPEGGCLFSRTKKKAFPSSSVLWYTSRSAAASRSELATDSNGSVRVVPPGTNGPLLMGWQRVNAFLNLPLRCKGNWANVAHYSQQVPWGIIPIAISEMNSVTYSNVNFICTRFRRQTAVCVCARKLQVLKFNTGVKTMSERTRDNGVTRCDTALVSHRSQEVEGKQCFTTATCTFMPESCWRCIAAIPLAHFANFQDNACSHCLKHWKKIERGRDKTRIWRKWIASRLNIYGDWDKFGQINFEDTLKAEFNIDPFFIFYFLIHMFISIWLFVLMFLIHTDCRNEWMNFPWSAAHKRCNYMSK